ncbi:MAG: hypothetical protein V4596_12000 [Bdellovibrionota bacterium]
MTTTSAIIVAMVASPPALHLDREQILVPVEPEYHLEQIMQSIPIHPLNISPKKILGDRFVNRVRAIDQRATEINSISFDQVTARR